MSLFCLLSLTIKLTLSEPIFGVGSFWEDLPAALRFCKTKIDYSNSKEIFHYEISEFSCLEIIDHQVDVDISCLTLLY